MSATAANPITMTVGQLSPHLLGPNRCAKMSAAANNYTYVLPITESYYPDVLEHLRHNFFADEPLNYAVGLCQHGEKHEDLEDHSISTLKDNLSVMAIDPETGKIVGVALNGILSPEIIEMGDEKLARVHDDKFRTIFTLLNKVNEDLGLFERYPVDKVYECRMLSVDNEYRGQGIAKELLKRSLHDAQLRGFKVFKQDATSFFTQKIAESLGFESIHEILYSDYTDEDGHPIFTPPSPHNSLKVMVKLIAE